MKQLDHNELMKDYQDQLPEMLRAVPDASPASVAVNEDYKQSLVVVSFANVSLYLTIEQARDLAVELRKSSNLLEKHLFERGVTSTERRRLTGKKRH